MKDENEDEDDVLVNEIINEELELETSSSEDELKSKSIEELHKLLDEAVNNEDYEKAAKLRDEISKR